MGWLKAILFAYAAVTAGIGIAGFASSGSVISMVAGIMSGALVAAGVLVAEKRRMIGYGLCLLVAIGLAGRFFSGAVAGDLYPAGVMFMLSVIVIIALGAGHFIGKSQTSRSGSNSE